MYMCLAPLVVCWQCCIDNCVPFELEFEFLPQIEYPVFWKVEEFCDGFLKLIDHLQLDKVSLYQQLCLLLENYCKRFQKM